MDREKLRRRHSLKVIISEFIMVLAVIITVVILAFIVSGYWLNSDLKVERQGMIQVSSIPTGSDLEIDGESSWLQRTNTSKILSSGEHTVTISREGYDSWSKTINISEGLLYRLHYPRLFLQERTSEKALDVKNAVFATVSPSHNKLLLAGDTTEWQVVDLRNDTLSPKKIDLAAYLPGVSLAENASVGLFAGKIITANWARDNNHVLVQITNENITDWILIDTENSKNSHNLSRDFGTTFTDVKILDNSANNLLAVQNDNLHKIDLGSKQISTILVKNIAFFDHYEDEIIFSAADEAKGYIVGLLKIGDSQIKQLESISEPAKVTISKFYEDIYLTILQNNHLKLYKKADFTPVSDFNLNFSPTKMTVGHNGEFITMTEGPRIATLDMEITDIREWAVEGNDFGWLDNDMIYTVADGELIVYDFDGFNRRKIAKNVSDHFPVTISDDKWLYYFSDGNLIREKLIP